MSADIRSVLMKQSKTSTKCDQLSASELEPNEEHQILAHISLPHDGGWGWVVVFSAFISIFILDGVAFTFGSILNAVAEDLKVSDSWVALVNSTAISLYFIGGPLASALINRFGFRSCAMSGSIISSISLFSSHLSPKYPFFFLFYGVLAGIGFSLINMSSGLIVGFYFERWRSVALAIASCGSSLGVMSMFPLNSYLVKLGGWRYVTLFHSGLFGTIFFFGMTYRPLLSFTVKKTIDGDGEETMHRTVVYLPSTTSAVSSMMTASTTSRLTPLPTTGQRLFNAVSNINFPTAADVIKELPEVELKQSSKPEQPGPSIASVTSKPKITLVPNKTDGALSERQLKQVQSIMSRTNERTRTEVNITSSREAPKKRSTLQRLLHWEPHHEHDRPLYRDDAFYEGKLTDLPVYQKSMVDTHDRGIGLEYYMAVSRTTPVHDLEDRRRVFTMAIRRVLATMMDPQLLKRKSFMLLCCSGFCTYLGFLVPYVFLKDRNQTAGIDPHHCTLFISVIGISNACGRLVLGSLAGKIDPLKLFSLFCILAGISTMASNASFNIYYQYAYCCVFGFSISSVACLRSIILVTLYGLDKLTNATGMMLIFLGLGNILSTPVAGVIKSNFGYALSFYIAGSFITLSGVVLIPVRYFAEKEIKTAESEAIPVLGKTNVKEPQNVKNT